MGMPRRRSESPAEVAANHSETTAVLESDRTALTERLHEAELNLAIESAASRILGFALARGAVERDPDE